MTLHSVIVVQKQTRWPNGASNFKHLDCPPIAGAPPWRSAVNALTEWLASQNPKPLLHIVLSTRFTRWQVLDGKTELIHPEEVAAYAALRFKETYGKLAENWNLRHSPQPPGDSIPVCAVDAGLLEALHQMCKDTGARLVCVIPYFSAAFDHWNPSIKGSLRWFGVVEPDCISLALLSNKGFVSLRSQRLDTPLQDALPGLLTQMGVACGISAGTLPIYLVGDNTTSSHAMPTGTPVQWLNERKQPPPAANQVGIRMAWGI